jgi:hypothetical protein
MYDSEAPARRRIWCPDVPRFQLCFGSIFWKVALVVWLLGEYKVWRARRLVGLLFYTPRTLFAAFAIAAVVTVVVDLVFRLVVRPLMVLWYHPRGRDPYQSTNLQFRLGSGETVLAEFPARRMEGRSRQPGTLVRTNRRVAFYPYAWDAEPWELDLGRLRAVRTKPTVRRVLGYVRGYPDHLVLQAEDGSEIAVVVADPETTASGLGVRTQA